MIAAGWFVLALLGQIAALSMIDAGPLVHYQHYPPLATLVATRPWSLSIVVAQALVVVLGLWGQIRTRGLGNLDGRTLVRLVAALGLSVCTAATVSPSVARYLGELTFAACLQGLSIATVGLMVLSVPPDRLDRAGRLFVRWLGPDEAASDKPEGSRVARLDTFAWTAAATSLIIAAALSAFSYQRHPHVPDEVAYLLHARYFAAGAMTMPAPPVPAAFDVDLMNFEPTRWFSPVPPGWPAVLAIGVRAGVPWLVNPILGSLNVLLTYVLVASLYSPRVARYAAGLIAVSPWCLFLSMSWMTDTLTLSCALVAALGVVRARRTGGLGAGLLAGAGVGATSLIRPLNGAIVGALIGVWAIGIGGKRLGWPALAGLASATVVVGAVTLPYNQMLTGYALTFPINAYTDKYHGVNSNAYGFGPDRGMGWPTDPNPGHGPVDGLINANLNAFGLSTDLFGWCTGSLVFVSLVLCLGRLTRSDWLMVSVIGTVFVAYFFYYFSGGPDFGARYWFPMVVPLAVLTARGIQLAERAAGPRATLAVAALVTLSLCTYVPWRAVDKYRNYRGMRADIRTLAATHVFAHDLVLVRGERFPDYASAAVQNAVDLQGDGPVYAWDRSEEVRAAVVRAFPDRRIWLVDGPTVTGSGYRVASGPLPPSLVPADDVR